MPGLQNRPSKQEAGSVHEGKKDQSGNHAKIKQRIRVIYSDPDATDCSSDDGNEGWNKVRNCFDGAERLVKEVCIFIDREKSCYRGGNKLPTKGKDGNSTRPSKHPGVRRRPWGKWVAEIRDPFTGKKNWLGTFLTEDEAVSAYQKKKVEYENSLQKQQGRNSSNIGNIAVVISETSNSEEINTNVMTSLPSPSSVLDAPTTNPLGAIPSFQNEAENQDVPITTSVEEPVLSSSNFVYLGIDVEHFFDDIRVEDLPCCELNVVAVTDFPNIDFDISSSDIAWIDELLNSSKREDR